MIQRGAQRPKPPTPAMQEVLERMLDGCWLWWEPGERMDGRPSCALWTFENDGYRMIHPQTVRGLAARGLIEKRGDGIWVLPGTEVQEPTEEPTLADVIPFRVESIVHPETLNAAQRLAEDHILKNVSRLVQRLAETERAAGDRVSSPNSLFGMADCRLFGFYTENDVYIEVLEHWIVTERLAQELLLHREVVDLDVWGVPIWGRTMSGQDLARDAVIQRIAEELR